MSDALARYLRLEMVVKAAENSGFIDLAESLRCEMDDIWHSMDDKDHNQINSRGEVTEP